MKYDISVKFLGKPFIVRNVEAESKSDAKTKVLNLLVFENIEKKGEDDNFKEATDLLNRIMDNPKK